MKALKIRFAFYLLFVFSLILLLITMGSCSYPKSEVRTQQKITESEIIAAQKAWGIGLIGIGVAYKNGGDYVDAAKNHIEKFYGFDQGKVLFKPSLVSSKPFRYTLEGALSYFVGSNPSFPEDSGFALKSWKDVRWENAGIINSNSDLAIAMGNYYFTDPEGEITKIEYTICYQKNQDGELKIVAHKSSLPFNGTG